MNAVHPLLLGSSLALAAALAACSSTATSDVAQKPASGAAPTDPGTDPGAGAGDGADPSPGAGDGSVGRTPPLATTRMKSVAAALAKGNVDVAKLPADMGDLTKTQLSAVMTSFTAALGVSCTDCHASRTDFETVTPKMSLTRKMWTNFVKGLALRDGSPVYCDTCHQGSATFLDRSNDGELSNWMKANFVDGLRRADASPTTCATCHGTPFVGDFLDAWKE